MLASINIVNFALIENLTLEFNRGMTSITGETGAGKSIVIDALGMALGERADVSMIRHGSERAEITASFELDQNSAALKWLEANELDEENECLIRRVLASEGRSKCFINGRPATLNMLKALGDFLVDIHGQHAHQSLLKAKQQLALVDQLISNKQLKADVANYARAHNRAFKQLQELSENQQQRQERIDLLRYQVDELDALSLSAEYIKKLESDHAKGNNMQELLEACETTNQSLFENETSLLEQLQRFQDQFIRLAQKDTDLNNVTELFAGASAQLEELKTELRHYQNGLDIDPAQLTELDQQLTTLFDLARKHHCHIEELPEQHKKLATELAELDSEAADLSTLQAQIDKHREDYLAAARQLSKARKATAKKLSKQVTERMHHLNMEGGQFSIEFETSEKSIQAHGIDTVEFMVTANPGQPMQPLNKVASGGELSRISLAIQVITAEFQVTPTLVFDEVDVGIGGQTADRVGRMLSDIANHAQVLCVTHQAQVAARGDTHLLAAKSRGKNETSTTMESLEQQARIDEIARMIGGQKITDLTLEHAKELIES